MTRRGLTTWYAGVPPTPLAPESGIIALTSADVARGAHLGVPVIPFHQAVTPGTLIRAPRVVVSPPPFRGHRYLVLLSWLTVSRLARVAAEVTWTLPIREAAGDRRVLEGIGWEFGQFSKKYGDRRRADLVALTVPTEVSDPSPRSVMVNIDGAEPLKLAADYGVFSPERVDDGTQLLLRYVVRRYRVRRLADIGIGYGALAIPLLAVGAAQRAVATDVDSIALWLAERNARKVGVDLATRLDPDPASITATDLTVCNFPTHLRSTDRDELVAALAGRSRTGDVVVVVHKSLVNRYARAFGAHEETTVVREGSTHGILEIAGPSQRRAG
jgi:predicted RNA methylase